MSSQPTPARVLPPGIRLKDEIEKRQWTQEDVARILGRPSQLISNIISGKRQITPTTALELADAFGMSPEFWNNLESDYQLHLAQQKQKENDTARGNNISKRSQLFDLLPIREILNRKWIGVEDPTDIQELEDQICAFAGISNIDEMPKLAANYKMSLVNERTPETRGQYAWRLRVNNLVRKQSVGTFEFGKLEALIQELLLLSVNPGDIRKIPTLLKRAGINFVIVPHLPKTYLDGAAFYIHDHPVIALTLRYDRIDNFWFVLIHELCHILLKHPEIPLDEVIRKNGRPDKNPIEQEADACTRAKLINVHSYQDFVEETFMELDETKIRNFAVRIKRHPAIVVGRLHWDNALHFSEGRHFLGKASPYLSEIIDKS